MTRQKSSSLDRISARCHECAWFSLERNALGQAAQHHDRTGHTVSVEQTTTVTYGVVDLMAALRESLGDAKAKHGDACHRTECPLRTAMLKEVTSKLEELDQARSGEWFARWLRQEYDMPGDRVCTSWHDSCHGDPEIDECICERGLRAMRASSLDDMR